jgi:hypothetical protein
MVLTNQCDNMKSIDFFWNSAKQQCLNNIFTLFNSYSICCQIAW